MSELLRRDFLKAGAAGLVAATAPPAARMLHMADVQVAAAWKTPAKYVGYEATPVPVRVKADAELIFKETK